VLLEREVLEGEELQEFSRRVRESWEGVDIGKKAAAASSS